MSTIEGSVDLRSKASKIRSFALGLILDNNAMQDQDSWILFSPGENSRHREKVAHSAGKQILLLLTRPKTNEFGDAEELSPFTLRIQTKEKFIDMDIDEKVWLVEDVTVKENGIAQYAQTIVEPAFRDPTSLKPFSFLENGQPDIPEEDTTVLSYVGKDKQLVYPFGDYDLISSPYAIEAANRILSEAVLLEIGRSSAEVSFDEY